MVFKGKFPLKDYGDELVNSYVLLKLLDKNQSLSYSRKLAKLSKGLDKKNIEEMEPDKAIDQSEGILNAMFDLASESFLGGQVFDEAEAKERPMNKEDLLSFPTKVMRDLTAFIQGTEKKS